VEYYTILAVVDLQAGNQSQKAAAFVSFDPPVFVVPMLFFLQGQDGQNPGCRKVPSVLLVQVATRIF
jgi:hypothetical protein